MSSPKESSAFTTRLVHTEVPGFWGKLLGGLGTVVTAAAKLAPDALPFEDKAAGLYSTKPNVPNLHLMPEFSTYHAQSNSIRQPSLTPVRSMPNYKPSRTGEKAVAQIQQPESSRQKANQWQAMQAQAFRTLNQMARAKGLPSYEQFHRENGVADKVQPGQGLLGVECSTPVNRHKWLNPGGCQANCAKLVWCAEAFDTIGTVAYPAGKNG